MITASQVGADFPGKGDLGMIPFVKSDKPMMTDEEMQHIYEKLKTPNKLGYTIICIYSLKKSLLNIC